jgi:hypothetical protein
MIVNNKNNNNINNIISLEKKSMIEIFAHWSQSVNSLLNSWSIFDTYIKVFQQNWLKTQLK